MTKTFRIAPVHELDKFIAALEETFVEEAHFMDKLKEEVKDLTSYQPDKYEQVLQHAINYLSKGLSLTINETSFQIKTLKPKQKAPKHPKL